LLGIFAATKIVIPAQRTQRLQLLKDPRLAASAMFSRACFWVPAFAGMIVHFFREADFEPMLCESRSADAGEEKLKRVPET
jgi:hypothetical protein